ncbi:MAG: hypothetical protein COV35_10650 [Alphaproteobacteria bacterium CG11_big_fil_rev_8_21_14_0_20_39_49]|nr:MAG: hypothetical protein COV35_10650 [Alphaproteobacteria bacterium CG11_big_fil_rev_8_21_14_0_20_39_49]
MKTAKDNTPLLFLKSRNSKNDDNTSFYDGAIAGALLATGAFLFGRAMLTGYLESNLFNPTDKNHKPLESPDKYGLEGEAKKLDTKDGDTIEIWHLKGKKDKPTVVFQHGNTGNLSYVSLDPKHQEENTAFRIQYLRKLQEQGIETIAVSSRGFGNSTGKPSEDNFKRDAVAVADYLEAQNIKPENTIITGESLGTSTATILAEEMTSRSKPPAGLTLIAPFSSMRSLILEKSAAPAFLIDMVLNHPLDTNKRLEHIASAARSNNKPLPHLLVVSPSEDKIIHPSHGDTLTATANKHDIPHTRQYQKASHVNWDASEVIDATLKIYNERPKEPLYSNGWGDRITKKDIPPLTNIR